MSDFLEARAFAGALENLQGFTNSIVNDTVMFPERVSALMAALSISLNNPILDPSDYILYNGYVSHPELRLQRNLGLLGRAVFDLTPKFVIDGNNIKLFAHVYRDLRRVFCLDGPEVRRLKSSTEISLRSRDSEINNVDLSDIILLSAIDALDLNGSVAEEINLPIDLFRKARNSLAHGRKRDDVELSLNLFTVWRNAFLIRLQEVNDNSQ
ncbi:hypothetical protein [Tropicibacter oceani]|uniref:RiboL-PSP-HEPN domain-containing protein n=1 Tax=Tropicibacter oceani TaxID=3058420 RepID=A0ABY8QIY0_9RHOB|nr:hypothetical protein [Tropicibacter oceani]WGW03951.1 hypothetical protein QF118_18865 [Tropicibacter oceani]